MREKKKMKAITGGGKGRTTPVTTACVPKSWKVEVCKKKNTRRGDQSAITAAIRSTSSTKQHKLIFQLRANTRPLAFDRQTTTATESGTTATKKHAILPSIDPHLRVAQLNNRRNLHNTTLEPPGTHPLAMLLLCVAFPGAVIVITTSSSLFSHACACHVYIYIIVSMYMYLPQFNRQIQSYDPYRNTMGTILE